jgi:chromosome partitioning protein
VGKKVIKFLFGAADLWKVSQIPTMQKLLIINAKGGCGKTTVATNLVAYFATQGRVTTLLDYDPQGSSMKWLSLRAKQRTPIHGIAAYQRCSNQTRSWQMRLPPQADWVIMDAPSGVTGLQLADFVRGVDIILVPVLPSPIDIHAAARFIHELLLEGKVRSRSVRVGIVANRVRKKTRVYRNLQRFLASLGLPFLATLHDSQNLIYASESGIGIHELEESRTHRDRECWAPLLRWLEKPEENPNRWVSVTRGRQISR